jgi:hypothetical protein
MDRRASTSTIGNANQMRISAQRSHSNPELNHKRPKPQHQQQKSKRHFHLRNPFKFNKKKIQECRGETVPTNQADAKATVSAGCTEMSFDGEVQIATYQLQLDTMKTHVVGYVEMLHERGPNLENLQNSCIKLTEQTKDLELTTRVVKKTHMGFVDRMRKLPLLVSVFLASLIFLATIGINFFHQG